METLFPKARAELLRLLFTDPVKTHHLRSLARLSGLAIGTIQREVAKMREAELILEERDGNRLYFRANTQHPFFPELRTMTLKTTGLIEPFSGVLSKVKGIELAFVYGSMAAGHFTSASDIDLFIIGSVGLRTLVPFLRDASETLSREINPTITTKIGYKQKLQQGDAYLENVTNGPKLWIIGSNDELAKLA